MPMTSPQHSTTRAGGAARVSKAERRRQLLGHARQLFRSHGYAGTSMEQVAAAAGVTEAVLARHFSTKKELFEVLLQELRTATFQRWEAETAGLSDPLARLHAITDLYLECVQTHADDLHAIHRVLAEGPDADVLELLRGFYLEAEALLARVIAEGQQTGVFRRPLDARVAAWEMIRSALGYSLTLPLGIPLFAEPDYLHRAVECLLHCLLKTDV
jgi:AcrR family transcriptional regulator